MNMGDRTTENIPVDICSQVIDDDPYGRVIIDGAGKVLHLNRAAAGFIGQPAAQLIGRALIDFVAPADLDRAIQGMMELKEAGPIESEGIPQVFGLVRPDGSVSHVEVGAHNYLDRTGLEIVMLRLRPFDSPFHFNRYFYSMLGRHNPGSPPDESELVISVDHLLQNASSALCSEWDGERFQHVSTQALPLELCGAFPQPEGVGTPWGSAIASGASTDCKVAMLDPPLREIAESHGFEACWVEPVPAAGADQAVTAVIIVWRTVPGPPRLGHRDGLLRSAGAASLGFERETNQRLLLAAATLDNLTGLPNRSQIFQALNDHDHPPRALLYLDLDDFKQVNDAHGHRAGDRILSAVAHRLQANTHPQDLLGRLGGDEFAVVVRRSCDAETLGKVADSLIKALAEPFTVDGTQLEIGLSVGIAIAGAASGEALLDEADHALYQSKHNGRGTWTYRYID